VRAFLDTDVLLGALSTRGLAADVVRTVLSEHDLITGEIVLVELRQRLDHDLRLPSYRIREVTAFLRLQKIEPIPDMPVSFGAGFDVDPLVLASAINARADVLVTGDSALLAASLDSSRLDGLRIVSPRSFWEMLRN
jgi:predicted nucleic acid-binding protein